METETDERVKRHVDRWADRCERRIRAHDPERRPPWDRARFLLEGWNDAPDFPGWVELADGFEASVREARGSSARFRQILSSRLQVV